MKEEFFSAAALQSKAQQQTQARTSDDQFLIISETQAEQIDSELKETSQK